MALATHSFALVLSAEPALTEELADRLYATFDDAMIGSSSGAPYAQFDREAESFREAVLSAIADVERVGLRVQAVEPDDHVSAAEIARRLGRSRENVRQWIASERGPGCFPAPISGVRTGSPRWRYIDVTTWLVEHKEGFTDECERARTVALLNAWLAQRHFAAARSANPLWRELATMTGDTSACAAQYTESAPNRVVVIDRMKFRALAQPGLATGDTTDTWSSEFQEVV